MIYGNIYRAQDGHGPPIRTVEEANGADRGLIWLIEGKEEGTSRVPSLHGVELD